MSLGGSGTVDRETPGRDLAGFAMLSAVDGGSDPLLWWGFCGGEPGPRVGFLGPARYSVLRLAERVAFQGFNRAPASVLQPGLLSQNSCVPGPVVEGLMMPFRRNQIEAARLSACPGDGRSYFNP